MRRSTLTGRSLRAQVENPSKKIRKYFKRARKHPISLPWVNGKRIKLMNNYVGRDWKGVRDVYRGFPVMALGTPVRAAPARTARGGRRLTRPRRRACSLRGKRR